MPDKTVPKKGLTLTLAVAVASVVGYSLLTKRTPSETPPITAGAQVPTSKPASPEVVKQAAELTAQPIAPLPGSENLPDTITPEGVKALNTANTPYVLVNADDPSKFIETPGPVRLVYYTLTPSYHSAQAKVSQDRQTIGTDLGNVMKIASQRLTGTPLDWQRLGLPIQPSPLPEHVTIISPKQLSEAIKDDTDLQILDLRPVIPEETKESTFPNALRLMPHEVMQNSTKLSKDKWLVLVGIDGQDANLIAFDLFQKGFVLTTVLEGGYQAWVGSTDR